MFQDMLKFRKKKKKFKKIVKTAFIMWSKICENMALTVHKITSKNIIYKIWTSFGYILADMQFVTQFKPVHSHPRS